MAYSNDKWLKDYGDSTNRHEPLPRPMQKRIADNMGPAAERDGNKNRKFRDQIADSMGSPLMRGNAAKSQD